jgi:hypothetical protein
MGGFTFHSLTRGPIAFTTVGFEPRRLVLEAMVAVNVGWEVVGKDCPDCMFAEITRASAVRALESARLYACRNPKFLLNDPVRWKGGKTSREIFFSVIGTILEELNNLEDEVVVIEDDYLYCEHERMKTPKRRRRRKTT